MEDNLSYDDKKTKRREDKPQRRASKTREEGKRERDQLREKLFFFTKSIYIPASSRSKPSPSFSLGTLSLNTQPSSDVVIQLDLREHFSILIDPIRLVHSTLQYILKFRSGGSGSFLELTGMTKRKENARLFSSPSQLDTALAHLRHKLYKLYDLYHF